MVSSWQHGIVMELCGEGGYGESYQVRADYSRIYSRGLVGGGAAWSMLHNFLVIQFTVCLTFSGLWGAYGLCPKSRPRRVGASPSEVYPAGKLQWHVACGFDFRHTLWLPFVAGFAVLKGLMVFNQHRVWDSKFGNKYPSKLEILTPVIVSKKTLENGNLLIAPAELAKFTYPT